MNKDLSKRLYYFSMFDGCLQRRSKGQNAYLIVNMLEENADYIERVRQTLEEVPLGCLITRPPIYTKDGYNRKQQLRLASKSHPFLTKIHERMYIDRCKVLDPHMLTLLDPEALAIAFMADGSRSLDKRWKNARPAYRLHTDNWSYGDNLLFKKALKEEFELEFNIHKKGSKYNLGLRTEDSELFEAYVDPYILPSFRYKLGQ